MGNLFGNDSGLSFFSKEQKQQMIENKTAFFITSLERRPARGDFKEQWVLSLHLCDDHATEGLLGFGTMDEAMRARMIEGFPSRDEIFEKLYDMISSTGEPYGPCCLYQGKKPSNGKQPFVGIRDVVEVMRAPIQKKQDIDNEDPF